VASMQRARRLASTAVVAVLAVTGLSACRNQPGTAAQFGGTTITQDDVDKVYTDAQDKLAKAVEAVRQQQAAAPDPSAQPVPDKVELSITRKDVLTAMIGSQVLRGIAQARNLKPTDIPTASVAQQFSLPQDATYITLYSEYRGYLAALLAAAKPVELTPAELRTVYDRFKAAGGLGEQPVEFEAFASQLGPEDSQVVSQTLGLRNDLKAEVAKLHATVYPRYGVN
jgi:hypothetical protein